MDLTILLTAIGIIVAIIIGVWQIYLTYKQIKNGKDQAKSDKKAPSLSILRDNQQKPTKKKKAKLPKFSPTKPSSGRKTKDFSLSLTPETFLITTETVVRFEIEATETMFYHAAKYKHETGGTLIGVRKEDEIHVKRANIGLETDFTQIDLATGELVIGFWHSHIGFGVFISGTDTSMLLNYPNFISVIIDPLSKRDAIGAFGLANNNVVRLKIVT